VRASADERRASERADADADAPTRPTPNKKPTTPSAHPSQNHRSPTTLNTAQQPNTITEKKNPFDELVEAKGVRVLIDPAALMHVLGTRMDWQEDKLRSEFVFINPNSKGSCGCGESFTT
jgi:hypothetical protein